MFSKYRFKAIILSAGLLMTAITGCGKKDNPELEAYKESMTEFYDTLSYYDNSINSIDPESDGAKFELLAFLDEINEAYSEMAAIPVPDEFSGIAEISGEAADYMQKANEFYHMAYDNEFDDESEQLASQYYERANNRVAVMLQVLHGEIPEGEGITVETESTYEIETIPTEDTEDQ